MKKSLFILLAASLGFAACQMAETDIPEFTGEVLSAQIEQNEETKTILDENSNIRWSENDQIVAFMKTSYGHKYQVIPSFAGKTYADFSMVSSGNGNNFSAGMEWDHNVAYYPYAEGIECVKSGENYTLDVTLPAEQHMLPIVSATVHGRWWQSAKITTLLSRMSAAVCCFNLKVPGRLLQSPSRARTMRYSPARLQLPPTLTPRPNRPSQ
jgi:hypothetical protein